MMPRFPSDDESDGPESAPVSRKLKSDEPVSSLERVRMAEIKAQREMEAEATAFAKDFFTRCFNSLDKGIEMAAKADLVRMVKD